MNSINLTQLYIVHCTVYSTWWTRLSIFVFSLAGTGCPPANRITERHLLYSTLASAFSLAGSGCPPANKITVQIQIPWPRRSLFSSHWLVVDALQPIRLQNATIPWPRLSLFSSHWRELDVPQPIRLQNATIPWPQLSLLSSH